MTDGISLPYGTTELAFELPNAARIIRLPEIEMQVSPEKFAADLAPFLADISVKGTIAVVVADKTRLCGYDRYLPVLLDEIVRWGGSHRKIKIYIAYGTHFRQSEAESKNVYGPAWDRFCFVHHDCRDRTLFRELGTTRRGTPVRVRKDICDADCLITFGSLSHHYFAGFGGGRKLVFPGLGEQGAIYCNHALFLDHEKRRLAAGCAPGRLSGNPLAEDLAEIESFRPADLSIHGILNGHGELCRLIAGKGVVVFEDACRAHGANCEVRDAVAYDLVLASCGGFPKDINFIQSHKSIHHAAMFVKDGGTLVVLAQCRDGVGSKTFLPWFDLKDREKVFDRLAADYQGNGGTALSIMEKLSRIKIFLVTDLDAGICERIGVAALSSEYAINKVGRHQGSSAVIPNAGYLVKSNRL